MIDFFHNFNVLFLQVSQVVLLHHVHFALLDLLHKLVFNFAYVQAELFLPTRDGGELLCDSFHSDESAVLVALFSAEFAVLIVAEEGVFGAFEVEAQLLDLLVGLAVESLEFRHVVYAEEGLKFGVVSGNHDLL